MDTKSQIINIASALFQQKGYKSVGLSEILKESNISKGALYHHFPNGKEELLIACLKSMEVEITQNIKEIFNQHSTTKKALHAMIHKLVVDFETEGTITGYTFTSIVSEMGSLSEPVRNTCSNLYSKIEEIFATNLVAEGLSKERARSIALTMIASIEGAIMLCLTTKTSDPLKTISEVFLETGLI